MGDKNRWLSLFYTKGGKLVNKHIDSISPATGGGGGKCEYGKKCEHIIADVIIPILF